MVNIFNRFGWGSTSPVTAKDLGHLVDDLQAWLNVDDTRLPDAKAKEIINMTIRGLSNKYMCQHNFVTWNKHLIEGQIDYPMPDYVLINFPHSAVYYESRSAEGEEMKQYSSYAEIHSHYPLTIQEASENLFERDHADYPRGAVYYAGGYTDLAIRARLEHFPLTEYAVRCYQVMHELDDWWNTGLGDTEDRELTFCAMDAEDYLLSILPDFDYTDPNNDDPLHATYWGIDMGFTGRIYERDPASDYDLTPELSVAPLTRVDVGSGSDYEGWWDGYINVRYVYAVPGSDETDDDHPCAYTILGRMLRVMPVPKHSNGLILMTYYCETGDLVNDSDTNSWLTFDWELVLFRALADFGPSYIFEQERIQEFSMIANNLEEQFAVREGKRNQTGERPVSEEP